MGTLIYGSPGVEVALDDRTLAHLRVVLLAKLRRDEKFALSWDDPEVGKNRTLWMHPSIPLQFELEMGANVQLNRTWIEIMSAAANGGSGLRLTPEPDPAPAASAKPEMASR